MAAILFAPTAFVVPTFLCASPSRAETLFDALKAVYRNNPALLAERARQRADDEAVPQALAGWRPTISVTGAAGKEKRRTYPPAIHSKLKPKNIGVKLSQPLFRGFRTLNATRQAKANVRAGQETLLDREQQLLLDAVTAYVDVLRNRQIVRLRKANVQFLTTELRAVETRMREGELTRTDMDQAKSRLFQGRSELALAEAQLGAAEARYGAVVGHPPTALAPVPGVKKYLPRKLDQAVAQGEQDNPLVLAAIYRQKAAEHEVQTLRGELLPTVSLDASYQRDYDVSSSLSRQDEGLVEFRFSMPIYNAGTNYSKIRQARATLNQRQHEVTNTIRDVKASILTAWRRRQAAFDRIRATQISVAAATAALKGIKIEADVGERSVFDILDAQRDVVNARVDQVNADNDFLTSSFTLLAAIGGLTAANLDLNVSYYDPLENYDRVKFDPGFLNR